MHVGAAPQVRPDPGTADPRREDLPTGRDRRVDVPPHQRPEALTWNRPRLTDGTRVGARRRSAGNIDPDAALGGGDSVFVATMDWARACPAGRSNSNTSSTLARARGSALVLPRNC